MKQVWSKFNVGDLVQIKKKYERGGALGVIIERKRGYILVYYSDDKQVHLSTPEALEIINPA